MLSVSFFHCVPRITAEILLAELIVASTSKLTDLVVVELGVASLDEWMMVLAIKNESVGRTSHLVFFESLGFWLLGFRNNGVVSEKIARGRDLNHTTIDIFDGCHWRFNHVANLEVKIVSDARKLDGSYRRRAAMMATPLSPMTSLRVIGTSMRSEAPELMF